MEKLAYIVVVIWRIRHPEENVDLCAKSFMISPKETTRNIEKKKNRDRKQTPNND